MTPDLPLVDGPQAEAALHGSYCPKMCTFACPVTAATGRDDAVPWSFHRTVTDLVHGHLPPSGPALTRLTACSGCLACRVPCLFDQDVPAQVRAGRAALHGAGHVDPAVAGAVARVAAGESPYPAAPAPRPDHQVAPASRTTPGTEGRHDQAEAASVAVVVGCRDDAGVVEDALRLLGSAGERPVAIVPDGCCGGALRDLGAAPDADAARERLAARLGDAPARVVALDPHCLGELRAAAPGGTEVVHVTAELHRLLEQGRLRLDGDAGTLAYHDPCLLARGEQLVEEPRALLRAAGAVLTEPEGHGTTTRCSGAGLALELLDEPAAEATAAARRDGLAATGSTTVVTACSGARARLSGDGRDVRDLLHLLSEHLVEDTA